jgi:SAM-dependent methyltransferase
VQSNHPGTTLLTEAQRAELLKRYQGAFPVEDLAYGTVRDFCDSRDHLQILSAIQGDLKDLQRPWTTKAVLGLFPAGSRLLEIGAGEPVVAQLLSELGYAVTVVDPYDGSGRGPTEVAHYRDRYPSVQIVQDVFSDKLADIEPGSYDCIYSISVLEHVHEPGLASLFRGIRRFLKPGGRSLHSIDQVLAGQDAEFHRQHLIEILSYQAELSEQPARDLLREYADIMERLHRDVEAYYLSAEGHNLWRGATPYDEFPFRKVVSINSCQNFGHAL